MIKPTRSVVALALTFFAFLALAVNWPILQGKTPLPAGMVTFYPPWEHLHVGEAQWPHVSELSDLVTAFYPWRAFTAEGFGAGELPLWNPRVLAGTPFLGATQSALFYPLTLLYAVFDTNIAWTLNILLRIVLAGSFTALFASRSGITITAAIGAGVVYVLSGSFVIWQGQALGDAWVWFPAVLYATDRLYLQPSKRAAVFLAIVFAMPVLAGHPESAFHIAVFAVIFAAFRLVCFETRSKTRFVLMFSIAATLGMALSAVQMLPTLEWMTQIDPELQSLYPGRPASEILALISRDLRSNPNSAGIHIPEGAAYAGMMALLLSGFAFLGTQRRTAWFWLAATVGAVQIAYGFGPLDWLVDGVPIVQALKNNRVVLIANFGIAVLAAMGLSFLEREATRHGRNWLFLAGGFSVVASAIFILRTRTTHHVPDWDQTPSITLLLLALGAIAIALRLLSQLEATTFATLAVGLIVIDMATAAFAVVPFAGRAEIFPRAPLFDFLARQKQPFRVTGVDSPYIPNAELVYGMSSISGYEIWLKRTAKLMDNFRTPGGVGLTVRGKGIVETDNRVLDLLNVRYLVMRASDSAQFAARLDRFRPVFSDRSIRVFENAGALPRAFAVPAGCVTVAVSDEEQLARVTDPSFEPLKSVVLPGARKTACEKPSLNNVDLRLDSSSPNRTEMAAQLNQDCIVVWSEMFYPGWRVFVDGQEQGLLRANYNLMAVAVPAGQHQVRFVFDPLSLRVGKWISSIAGILLAAAFFWR